MKIILTNEFHNSETIIKAEPHYDEKLNLARIVLSKHQAKRSKRALCGFKGCTCSDSAGTRGTQYLIRRDGGMPCTLIVYSKIKKHYWDRAGKPCTMIVYRREEE